MKTNGLMSLFVDASYDNKFRGLGWGGWVRCDFWERGEVIGGSFTHPQINSSNMAELVGIMMALKELKALGNFNKIDSIMVQCDNVNALGTLIDIVPGSSFKAGSGRHDVKDIERYSFPLPSPTSEIRLMIRDVIKDVFSNRRLYLRHIKGHNKSLSGRSWVNDKCDEVAKQHLKSVRGF